LKLTLKYGRWTRLLASESLLTARSCHSLSAAKVNERPHTCCNSSAPPPHCEVRTVNHDVHVRIVSTALIAGQYCVKGVEAATNAAFMSVKPPLWQLQRIAQNTMH
jgi:hypothetical protein